MVAMACSVASMSPASNSAITAAAAPPRLLVFVSPRHEN
jgi:hypothetical protein